MKFNLLIVNRNSHIECQTSSVKCDIHILNTPESDADSAGV